MLHPIIEKGAEFTVGPFNEGRSRKARHRLYGVQAPLVDLILVLLERVLVRRLDDGDNCFLRAGPGDEDDPFDWRVNSDEPGSCQGERDPNGSLGSNRAVGAIFNNANLCCAP